MDERVIHEKRFVLDELKFETEARGQELGREVHFGEERYFRYLHEGRLLMQTGRWDESAGYFARSAQMALQAKNDFWLALSHAGLGDLAAAEENWFGALHHYRYASRTASAHRHPLTEHLEAKMNAVRSTLQSVVLPQDATVLALGTEYVSGNIAISFVQRDIFLKKYFARCLDCQFCHDWCCSFGADIDVQNVEKIKQHREGILPFVRPPQVEWFEPEYSYYEEYAGNQYTRINPQGPRCAFISKDQRGCGLHRYALAAGMDYHEIKPLICILFPLSFSEGILSLADELDDNSLVCSDAGDSAYRSLRSELEYYFGKEFVEELDKIENRVLMER